MALVLTPLIFAGGIPREVCVCPDAECRAACVLRTVPFLGTEEQSRRCCCEHCTADAAGEREDAAGWMGCACPTVVKQRELTLPPRAPEFQGSLLKAWVVAGDDQLLVLHRQDLAGEQTARSRLGPVDPVSLAQILRI